MMDTAGSLRRQRPNTEKPKALKGSVLTMKVKVKGS